MNEEIKKEIEALISVRTEQLKQTVELKNKVLQQLSQLQGDELGISHRISELSELAKKLNI
jgi:hypothetical protein